MLATRVTESCSTPELPIRRETLGGLVHVGRRIEEHLRSAIELGRLCSNDPVCSQHSAKHALEEQYLLGAACHGCLLIADKVVVIAARRAKAAV
jgi:hypothetical protein